jgi:apolipoprotein N-acyltransferase
MTSGSKNYPSRTRPAIWLLLAGAILLFAMGRDTVALAAWIAPIFFLRFTRTTAGRFVALAGLVKGLVWLFQFRGMVPVPFWAVLVMALPAGMLGLVPYAIDRWLKARTGGFAATLIFPCAVAGFEFCLGSISPYGSWCAVGYSQYGNLPIMQVSAITGLYGISFLVSWLGAVVNWAWEHGFECGRVRRGAIVFLAVQAAVYLGGSARLLFDEPQAGYKRVAGIAAEGNERLFAKSESEAKAGAKLVFWSEGAAQVRRSDEPALIQKGAELARRNRVFLGMGLLSYDPGQPKPSRNKLILIGPNGDVLFEYWKSRPVPGPEKDMTETNGNPMRFADTPLGRIGAFICFDMDFPDLIRQAGRVHADLVIAPSNDWEAIDPWNTQMAVFRAVENGFNLVRNVSHGRSIATDFMGRILAETDYFTNTDHTIVAYLPSRGARTIYGAIGDLFAWTCIGMLVLLGFVGRCRGGTGPG